MSDFIIDVANEMAKDGWDFDFAMEAVTGEHPISEIKEINNYIEGICERIMQSKYN